MDVEWSTELLAWKGKRYTYILNADWWTICSNAERFTRRSFQYNDDDMFMHKGWQIITIDRLEKDFQYMRTRIACLLQETHLGFEKIIRYFMQGPWAIWRCSACPHLIWCLCLHFNFIFFNSLCQNKQHSIFTIRPLFTTLKIQWFSERFILNDGYCNKQDMNKHDFQINHYSFFYNSVSYYYIMFKLHRAQQNNKIIPKT